MIGQRVICQFMEQNRVQYLPFLVCTSLQATELQHKKGNIVSIQHQITKVIPKSQKDTHTCHNKFYKVIAIVNLLLH